MLCLVWVTGYTIVVFRAKVWVEFWLIKNKPAVYDAIFRLQAARAKTRNLSTLSRVNLSFFSRLDLRKQATLSLFSSHSSLAESAWIANAASRQQQDLTPPRPFLSLLFPWMHHHHSRHWEWQRLRTTSIGTWIDKAIMVLDEPESGWVRRGDQEPTEKRDQKLKPKFKQVRDNIILLNWKD